MSKTRDLLQSLLAPDAVVAPVLSAEAAAFRISDAFLESHEWCQLRYRMLLLHGARCEACGSTRQDGVRIVVDHIIPRRERPDLALDPQNLQVLCAPCNFGKGSWDRTSWHTEKPAVKYLTAEPLRAPKKRKGKA